MRYDEAREIIGVDAEDEDGEDTNPSTISSEDNESGTDVGCL